MTQHDHNFSFAGGQTDDPEELIFECRSALAVVSHVCSAPDDPQPTGAVFYGVHHIVEGVMATLDTLSEHIASEARSRSLLHIRPTAVRHEDLKKFEERWGEDATKAMCFFIFRHYGDPPDGEGEGPASEADNASDT